MNSRRTVAPRATRGEAGFTLVELLIVIVLLGLVTAALTSSFITALRGNDTAAQRVDETNDAQLVASFLVRDAQAAGGSNPATGSVDPSLGVSLTDAASCTDPDGAALVVRFKWNDRVDASTFDSRVVTYNYDAASMELRRRSCTNGSFTDQLVLATNVGTNPEAPAASCNPSANCPGLPDTVTLTVSTTNAPQNAPTPYTYSLKATVRPRAQTAPTLANSGMVPLLALGDADDDSCAGTGGPALDIGGGADVTLYGNAFVNVSDGRGCTAMHLAVGINGSYDNGTNGTFLLGDGSCSGGDCASAGAFTNYTTPLPDPFAGLPAPAASCAGGSNPVPVADHYTPGGSGVLVFPHSLSVNSNVVFDPGVYVMCGGASFQAGADVQGSDVMFYVPNGSFAVQGQASFGVSAPSTGEYANVLVWVPKENGSPIGLSGGAVSNTYGGAVYGPASTVTVSGGNAAYIGMIVAERIVFIGGGGDGLSIIGTAPLSVSSPTDIPDGVVGQLYPTQTFTAAGGLPGYTFSETGALPGGMSFAGGSLSGTPTQQGNFDFEVTVTDSQGTTASRNYQLVVNAAPASSFAVEGVVLGNQNGRIVKGDTVTVTFSDPIAVASMCSAWSNNGANQQINQNNQVTVHVNDNAGATGNDTLTVESTTCTFNFGTLDLGSPSWTSSNLTFEGTNGNKSTITYTAAASRLVVTLGGGTSGANNIAAQTITYTPDTAVTDATGDTFSAPTYSFGNQRF
jgi:prepilin-type N-terminal cleavage/methylation domain-containing protein